MARIFMILSLFSSPDEMIADIKEPVVTEFGVYKPYLVDVTPCCTLYKINPDFSNIKNFKDFEFTEKEESLLVRNGFCANPSSYKEMYDIYRYLRERKLPIFVSFDAMLHSYHRLYNYILKRCEEDRFIQYIKLLTDSLLKRTKRGYDSCQGVVKEAEKLNLAYFSVAKLLEDSSYQVPEIVRDMVEEEIRYISLHDGWHYSPIFGYKEDYSQYIPRGHYTDNEGLKKYFKQMMWYGRMTFVITPPELILPGIDPDSLVKESTRRAIILLYHLLNIQIDGESALSLWEKVYIPTVFFVGKTDDINIYQYKRIAEEVYGKDFAHLPIQTFANDSLLQEFIKKARNLPKPKIGVWGVEGFKFMGQRFIPDSYVLDRLVMPYTSRNLPKGLDVMAVLGSERAYEILDKVYHETEDVSYGEMIDTLKKEFRSLPDSMWAKNIYYNWLYCLMPLLFTKDEGFPFFMQNQAWLDKELYSALGSWTELRHDVILYAKQSYTESIPGEYTPKGYVEPNPWAFARLASLVDYTAEGLGNLGLFFDDIKLRLRAFKNYLLTMKKIAEKELEYQELTEEEEDAIYEVGLFLQKLVDFDDEFSDYGVGSPAGDDEMPVVADVHTGLEGVCLEEGVGYPMSIYVVIEYKGSLWIAQGAIYSYFEFSWPISERLTDEAWKELLQTEPPPAPEWIQSFVDLETRDFLVSESYHAITGNDIITGIKEKSPKVSLPIQFLNKEIIEFSIPNTGWVEFRIYDASGRLIRTPIHRYFNEKTPRVKLNELFSEKMLPQGIYFIVIKQKEYQKAIKVIFL